MTAPVITALGGTTVPTLCLGEGSAGCVSQAVAQSWENPYSRSLALSAVPWGLLSKGTLGTIDPTCSAVGSEGAVLSSLSSACFGRSEAWGLQGGAHGVDEQVKWHLVSLCGI